MTRAKVLIAAVACAACVLSLVPASAGASSPALITQKVAVKDDFFSPTPLTVHKGQAVKWVNVGKHTHTTTSTLWNATLAPGTSFTRVFRATGKYSYKCRFHSNMVGTIKVIL
jgi:plastocyanin